MYIESMGQRFKVMHKATSVEDANTYMESHSNCGVLKEENNIIYIAEYEPFCDRLKKLAEKIRSDKLTYLKTHNLSCDANIANTITKIVSGKKYTKIDVGRSGFIMIDNESGNIYGIKGYGVINKSHKYGTLDTIDDWFWGYYTPSIKN